ncbi:MAG: hypothetical protein CMJ86_10300 [Planctomycetes bacterium]|nr:hypothetical protein [Planctomycetota bacterium]
MIEGFLNPALALGAALAAVPLIIHLLNRQRFRPAPWGAMRFVLAAHRRTRRRVQLENLLLLLLRMGAVALLAFAIARPFVRGASGLGQLTEHTRDVVLILDGSASTGLRQGAGNTFDLLREGALALAAELDGSDGDRLYVILAGSEPRLVSWPSPEKALLVLPTLGKSNGLQTTPTDERANLSGALDEALRLVRENAGESGISTMEVHLYSDSQRDLFLRPDSESLRPALAETLSALEGLGVSVLVRDMTDGNLQPDNCTVEGITLLGDQAQTNTATEIIVHLRSYSSKPRAQLRVALSVNGNRLPSQRINLPAGGHFEARFPFTFTEGGAHTLVAELDGDQFALDDLRHSVIILPPPTRVLVVNGSPSDDLLEDEAGFLILALEAPRGDGRPSPFEVDEVSAGAFAGGDTNLADFDVIWLADVGTVSNAAVSALEKRVGEGASLVISCGERMADLESLRQRMFRSDGSGLLPAEPIRRVSSPRRESYYRVKEFDATSPILEFFASERHRRLLTEIPIDDFLGVRPLGDARVLASLDDDANSPLLIERPWAAGRTFLWTTTIGRAWTPLPQLAPAMVPLVVEWVRYAGRRDATELSALPGESPVLKTKEFPRQPILMRPDGTTRTLAGEPTPTPAGQFILPRPAGNDTQRVGLYTVRTADSPPIPFAISVDPAESDLVRLSPQRLGSLHPNLVIASPRNDSTDTGTTGEDREGELWRLVAWLCLLFLVCESLWGARLGRRRGGRA